MAHRLFGVSHCRLQVNRGLPGSAVYDLSTDRQPVSISVKTAIDKEHEMPVHHLLEQILDAYMVAAGLQSGQPLFQSVNSLGTWNSSD
jgi:hypothetical protein